MQFKLKDFRHFPWEKNPPCWKIPSLDLLLPLFMLHLRNNDTFYPDNIFLKGGIVKYQMHMTEEREHHQMHRHQFTLNIIHIYKQSAMVLFWMHIICFSKLTFKIKDKLDCFIVGNKGQIRHRLSSTQKTMYLSVVCTY